MRRGARSRGDVTAIMQLGVWVGRRGSARHSVPGTMRGSTAGLADTLAGGSRAYSALLEGADALFASAVVAPAVVTYWQSTWSLMDLYVLPEDSVGSAAACAGFGLLTNLLLCVLQTRLARALHPDRGRVAYCALSRLYTVAAGVACVAAWRGVWNLLNECTGHSARTLLSTTAAATLSLAALRAARNICAAPFAVALDSPQDYFDVPTMFRTVSYRSFPWNIRHRRGNAPKNVTTVLIPF